MHKGGAVSVPSRYGPLITVMQEMHWSWQDITDTPVDLLEEIIERVRAQAHWRIEKSKFDESMGR